MGFVALMLGRDISLSHSFPFKRKTQNCATRTGAHRHTFTFHYIHTSFFKFHGSPAGRAERGESGVFEPVLYRYLI